MASMHAPHLWCMLCISLLMESLNMVSRPSVRIRTSTGRLVGALLCTLHLSSLHSCSSRFKLGEMGTQSMHCLDLFLLLEIHGYYRWHALSWHPASTHPPVDLLTNLSICLDYLHDVLSLSHLICHCHSSSSSSSHHHCRSHHQCSSHLVTTATCVIPAMAQIRQNCWPSVSPSESL